MFCTKHTPMRTTEGLFLLQHHLLRNVTFVRRTQVQMTAFATYGIFHPL